MRSKTPQALPPSLSLAIDAYVTYSVFLFDVFELNKWNDSDTDRYRHAACAMAEDLGERYPDTEVPALFKGTADLEDFWTAGCERALDRIRSREHACEVQRLLSARNWSALGMPTPDALISQLATTGHAKVAGYALYYDRHGGAVLFSNPYREGWDDRYGEPWEPLGAALEPALLEHFLIDVANHPAFTLSSVPH